ncbi:MAG: hypothetical protein ACM3PX_09635 [Omnitrophica WOR_2 bacterium]|jgi:hypothetical protein
MSVLDPRKTLNNLKKKGFIEEENKSPDHKRLALILNGKLVTSTKLSHNGQDIDNYLIKQMSCQCHLTKDEFIDLATCPLSKEEYFQILAKQGLLD